jgi:SAM-dependent methyltransferase
VALDSIEMRSLLFDFITRVVEQQAAQHAQAYAQGSPLEATHHPHPLKFIDLGCGTGRNTIQLLKVVPSTAEVVGLDVSPGMLAAAQTAVQRFFDGSAGSGAGSANNNPPSRCGVPERNNNNVNINRVTLDVYDMLGSASSMQTSTATMATSSSDGNGNDDGDNNNRDDDDESLQIPAPPPPIATGAAGIISTLVLEHVPARVFFRAAASMLQYGGYFLLTNMHADMGRISQAGFIDRTTGKKIRPTSYNHEVKDVLTVARQEGFELVGPVLERAVEEGMLEVLGTRAKKWVGVAVWFGMCFQKKKI